MHNYPIYGYFAAFNGTRQQKFLAIRTLRRFLHMFTGVGRGPQPPGGGGIRFADPPTTLNMKISGTDACLT